MALLRGNFQDSFRPFFGVFSRRFLASEMTFPQRLIQPARSILDFEAGKWSPVRSICPTTQTKVQRAREIHGDAFLIAYYGSEKQGRSLDVPLGTVTTRDRHALVVGNRLRMLSIEESHRAMGFPPSYVLPPQRKLAIYLLGNAVPPPLAADVIRAAISAPVKTPSSAA